ncbi:UNVERIFIED_CONTAM: hypothetical protein GTU68_012111 [Idotea baltica]|nr:hypothetical protein [Idotea baltica]
MTNITPQILSKVGQNLHLQNSHPLGQLCRRIVNFVYEYYLKPRGNPLFSIHDRINPVVTKEQNFDSLLVPKDHVTRQQKDNYYINEKYLLRAHTTSHQTELIKMGFNNFLVVGDVFRRDEIDSSHYPVFHQADGVRLFSKQDVFGAEDNSHLSLFDKKPETEESQGCHSQVVVNILTKDLKVFLISLANSLFGKDLEWRWVDAYFPFTHPSWELEVKFGEKWVEMLGCGIIRQDILNNSGAGDKVGWAFGLGLERWAMKMFQIPDIRIFWSTDSRFLEQFNYEDPNTPVTFKHFSNHPPCMNDISFWLPASNDFSSEDFYELVRNIGEDTIERVELIDNFTHPKKRLTSHCYRVTYRSWERAMTQEEANRIHSNIAEEVTHKLGVTLR